MPLIIDGYNLLHAAGILGGGTGPKTLEKARLALLNFLAESLTAREIAHTTVVFDSHEAPWGAPNRVEHRGLTVLFAARWPDADCLIEELIGQHNAPRRLTVVSSDHRLQRAARRRKAKAVDSEVWYRDLVQKRLARRKSAAAATPERPSVPLLAEDVEYWVRQFGGQSELDRWMMQELADHDESPAGESTSAADSRTSPSTSPAEEKSTAIHADSRDSHHRSLPEGFSKDGRLLDIFNPFPPGYAEDVEE